MGGVQTAYEFQRVHGNVDDAEHVVQWAGAEPSVDAEVLRVRARAERGLRSQVGSQPINLRLGSNEALGSSSCVSAEEPVAVAGVEEHHAAEEATPNPSAPRFSQKILDGPPFPQYAGRTESPPKGG